MALPNRRRRHAGEGLIRSVCPGSSITDLKSRRCFYLCVAWCPLYRSYPAVGRGGVVPWWIFSRAGVYLVGERRRIAWANRLRGSWPSTSMS